MAGTVKINQSMLRAYFVKRLEELDVDPLANLAKMLQDVTVEDDVKANINLQLLKLLVPPPPKEIIADLTNGTGSGKVIVHDYIPDAPTRRTTPLIEAAAADAAGEPIMEVAGA